MHLTEKCVPESTLIGTVLSSQNINQVKENEFHIQDQDKLIIIAIKFNYLPKNLVYGIVNLNRLSHVQSM